MPSLLSQYIVVKFFQLSNIIVSISHKNPVSVRFWVMTHVHTYKHSPDGFISLLVSGLRSLNPTDGSHAALLTNNLFTFHMLTARIIRCITHRDTGTRLRQFIRFSYCWNNWNKTFFTFRFVWNYTLHL